MSNSQNFSHLFAPSARQQPAERATCYGLVVYIDQFKATVWIRSAHSRDLVTCEEPEACSLSEGSLVLYAIRPSTDARVLGPTPEIVDILEHNPPTSDELVRFRQWKLANPTLCSPPPPSPPPYSEYSSALRSSHLPHNPQQQVSMSPFRPLPQSQLPPYVAPPEYEQTRPSGGRTLEDQIQEVRTARITVGVRLFDLIISSRGGEIDNDDPHETQSEP